MIYKKIPLDENDKRAYLEVYVADEIPNFVRKAILVVPGGGYTEVCHVREGEPIAMAFMPHGYNAFVLHYSVGSEGDIFPKQLLQASKAIKHIKDNADEYNIDPENVFAVGFSAGGHLVGTLGIMWDNREVNNALDMEFGYNKPKGVMMIYPVVTGINREDAHMGSFINLIGKDEPTDEELIKYSLERHVNKNSSPAYIFHTYNDDLVPVKNSIYLAQAYVDAGVPCELHIYPDAPHGVALGNRITRCDIPKYENTAIAKWIENAVFWADNL